VLHIDKWLVCNTEQLSGFAPQLLQIQMDLHEATKDAQEYLTLYKVTYNLCEKIWKKYLKWQLQFKKIYTGLL
jgi:hypothetical protein